MIWHPCSFDPRFKPERGLCELDRDHPLSQGLESAWLFNEGAGAIPSDLNGRRLATLQNGATWGAGGVSLASGAYITAGSITPSEPFTVIADVTLRAAGVNAVFVNTGGNAQWLLFCEGGQFKFRAIGTAAAGTQLAGRYRVAGVRVGVIASLFIGGALAATVATGALPGTASTLEMGRYSSGVYELDGILHGVWLYSRGLTPSEIAWQYAEPYAMLRPIVRRTYGVPASGGNLLRRRRMAVAA